MKCGLKCSREVEGGEMAHLSFRSVVAVKNKWTLIPPESKSFSYPPPLHRWQFSDQRALGEPHICHAYPWSKALYHVVIYSSIALPAMFWTQSDLLVRTLVKKNTIAWQLITHSKKITAVTWCDMASCRMEGRSACSQMWITWFGSETHWIKNEWVLVVFPELFSFYFF